MYCNEKKLEDQSYSINFILFWRSKIHKLSERQHLFNSVIRNFFNVGILWVLREHAMLFFDTNNILNSFKKERLAEK